MKPNNSESEGIIALFESVGWSLACNNGLDGADVLMFLDKEKTSCMAIGVTFLSHDRLHDLKEYLNKGVGV